jgi:hypothetical protein
MSNYSCPECKDGTLEAKVREVDLDLQEGEAAQIVGGVVLVTSVGCDNGCGDEAEKPKKRKKHAAAAGGHLCEKADDCDRPTGHTGRCNHKGKPESAEA